MRRYGRTFAGALAVTLIFAGSAAAATRTATTTVSVRVERHASLVLPASLTTSSAAAPVSEDASARPAERSSRPTSHEGPAQRAQAAPIQTTIFQP